jgi:hypothetical protein
MGRRSMNFDVAIIVVTGQTKVSKVQLVGIPSKFTLSVATLL